MEVELVCEDMTKKWQGGVGHMHSPLYASWGQMLKLLALLSDMQTQR